MAARSPRDFTAIGEFLKPPVRKAGSQQGRVHCEAANPDLEEPSVPSLACLSRVDDLAAGKAIRFMLNLFSLTLEDVVVGGGRATQWSSARSI